MRVASSMRAVSFSCGVLAEVSSGQHSELVGDAARHVTRAHGTQTPLTHWPWQHSSLHATLPCGQHLTSMLFWAKKMQMPSQQPLHARTLAPLPPASRAAA